MRRTESHVRRRPSWRGWQLWDAHPVLRRYMLCVDAVGFGATIAVLAVMPLQIRPALEALLLLALAIIYGEISTKASRLHLKLRRELKTDMSSVWTLPAALLLPPGYTAILLAALLYYMWRREHRPMGVAPYRRIVSFALIGLACYAGHFTYVGVLSFNRVHDSGVVEALAVAAGLLVYTLVNRVIATGGAMLMGESRRGIVGSWDENMLEFSTLCLGALIGVALVHQPLLTPLVLVPMVVLQRVALVRQLEVAATTDAKTGLLNAVAWENIAERELARSVREQTPTGVLLLDLDRFKLVNDVHGHLVGDVVLREIGRCIGDELRGYDSVGRFGGEEFVAVLPRTTLGDAVSVAERIRERVSLIMLSSLVDIADPDTDRRLTASIGVACAPVDGTEVQELLHVADAALYRAKAAGRNRVEASRGMEPGPAAELRPA